VPFGVGRHERAQPGSKSAHGGLLQDSDLIGLARFVELGEHSRCTIATAQAGNALNLDVSRISAQIGGDGFERGEASGRTSQMASDVAADANFDIRRRLTSKMREKADHLIDPMQRNINPGGEPFELIVREIADTLLDRT
jgi:hypothetical protein